MADLSLGSVSYDIVAQDKTKEGLDGARGRFAVTAGDIVNAIKSVSDELAKFDEKNANLNTNLGLTALTLGMDAEELRSWASELSDATDPIDEMAGLIDELARAGVRGHDSMIETANGFDALADAVNRPADQLTNQLIPAFKAMQIPVEDIALYSDRLAYTFNATEVSVDDFSRTITRMGPELHEAGVSMNDLEAIMVILKERGYDGKNMMSELTDAMKNATDANNDGKISLDEMLASMKITNAEFDTANNKIDNYSQNYTARAKDVVDSSTSMSDKVQNTTDNMVLGLGGLTTPITQVASLFSGLAGTISTVAIPAMLLFPQTVAGIGASITGALSGISGSVTTAATAIGGSLAAGILAGVGVGLAGVFTLDKLGILSALSNIGAEIENSDIGSSIMDALKIVLAPIGGVGAAIIDIVRGDFADIPDDMAEPFEQAGEAVGRSLDRIRSVVSGGIGDIREAFSGLNSSLSGASGAVHAMASSSFSGIASAFQAMAGQVQGVFSQMMSALQNVITSTAGGFFNAGQNIITSMANGVIAAGGGIIKAITDIWQKIANIVVLHSPAKEGPLSESINWAGYLTDGMPQASAQVKVQATTMVQAAAEGITAPTGGPAPATAGTTGGDIITISPGAIVINGAGQNAKEIADMVIKQFADVRRQRGIRA